MKSLFLLFAFLLSSFSAFAADENGVFRVEAAKSCDAYTGTWEGMMIEPAGLYGTGGPWKVNVALLHREGCVIGQTRWQGKYKKIWARCDEGKLKQVFWGERGDCGRLTEQAGLLNPGLLLLELNQENAMMGTRFYLFLNKRSDRYPFVKPTEMKDYQLPSIKSCH